MLMVRVQAEVERMEREELELIQKLQNTQLMQKEAYDNLEGALNGDVSPEKLSSMNSTARKGFSPATGG